MTNNTELCYLNNPHSLFRKYVKLVTYFTKHQLGRDYLGIKDKDITRLLPNGYYRKNKHEAHGVFHTKAIYSPKLTPALQRIDIVSHYLCNFNDALKTFFYQAGLIRNPYLVPDVMLATFNPDADVESTSVDGTIGRLNVDETLTTIRAGAGTAGSANDSATSMSMIIQCSATTDQFRNLRRNIHLYDTSSLSDSATLESATIYLKDAASLNEIGAPDYHFVASTPASNTALVDADFSQLASTSFGSYAYGDFAGSTITSTLNATGLATISKTGITKFGTRNEWDLNNNFTSGTWGSTQRTYADPGTADHATASYHPVLTVNIALEDEFDNYSFFM